MPVRFLWCEGSWLGCAVVPVMGALFQSRGWLPIVEAPGYFRHPTSILAMQLLTNICRIKRDGISAIKFESVQIHFLSDVVVAVAVVTT